MKDGLWIPRAILEKYNFGESGLAAALFEFFTAQDGGNRTQIRVPLKELLLSLSKPDTPEVRRHLEKTLYAMYRLQHVTYMIRDEGGVDILTIYFTPEIAKQAEAYERKPEKWKRPNGK